MWQGMILMRNFGWLNTKFWRKETERRLKLCPSPSFSFKLLIFSQPQFIIIKRCSHCTKEWHSLHAPRRQLLLFELFLCLFEFNGLYPFRVGFLWWRFNYDEEKWFSWRFRSKWNLIQFQSPQTSKIPIRFPKKSTQFPDSWLPFNHPFSPF